MFFDPVKRKPKRAALNLKSIEREPQAVELMTEAEQLECIGDRLFLDIECYPNYFLVALRSMTTGKVAAFEESPDSTLDRAALGRLLWAGELVTFNGGRYDIPLLSVALVGGVSCETLKQISDELILENARPSDIEKAWSLQIQRYNHIDLFDVAPLQASLKKYAARMHTPRLQELPYSPHKALTKDEAEKVRAYCFVDLMNTEMLYNELREQIQLRESLSKQYNQDLRSKSDAQIAEAVIVSEVVKLTGKYPKRAKFSEGESFHYVPPDFIKFQTPDFQHALQTVKASEFVINEHGSPRCEALQEISLRLGSSVYAMGIGGLHSQEKSRALIANKSFGLVDIDVASYYPKLILNSRIMPTGMGESFLTVYQTIVDRRLQAKREGNKVEADSLKITANGTFGKLGSAYSAMYSADGMIQVTLTGQLSILVLIERLHLAGFDVASGNTDGVVVRYERTRKDELDLIVKAWERDTDLQTEETHYEAIFNRDVNNYIAIKENDGEFKVKGVYAEKGSTGNTRLSKNPEGLILADAVTAYLTKSVPIEKTIYECKDLRRFVTVRDVKGGGELNGVYLGKVVRYYYAKGRTAAITYIASGNKVPNSDGARECMDMPSEFPDDVDLERYVQDALQILCDIGFSTPAGFLF